MSAPKQIIVIRKDLNMRKGKMIAQGAHASMAPILEAYRNNSFTKATTEWLSTRFTKICVYVNSEQELLDVYQKAKDAGIQCALIKDAGLTEFKEPTHTAVGIGPAYPEEIDPITGNLPLL